MEFCQWLQQTSLGVSISESAWLFPILESLHVIALALVVGSIAVVDLRLLGWASKDRLVSQLTEELLPFTWAAFAAAAITGFLLFMSNAVGYIENYLFRAKLLLLVLAAVNMCVFHFLTYRTVSQWDHEVATLPTGAKVAGALSLTIWLSIIVVGRWIGFV
jgi:hypothetical protein